MASRLYTNGINGNGFECIDDFLNYLIKNPLAQKDDTYLKNYKTLIEKTYDNQEYMKMSTEKIQLFTFLYKRFIEDYSDEDMH